MSVDGTEKVFVDTNVLMYAHDTTTGAKHEAAAALVAEIWRRGQGVLSTQVLQELAVNLRRKAGRPLDAAAVRAIVSDYLAWEVVVNNGDSILGALEIESQHRISFWDALVLHAAAAAGAGVLYSEDLNDGQIYGTVRVVSPWRR